MEELVSEMKVALATAYTYQLKAHYYHWNVEGSDFPQYHQLFGMIYEDVDGSIDQFAEEIRALDAYAPGSYTRFSELSLVEEDNTIVSASVMIMRLLNDTYTVISHLTSVYELCENNKKYGLSDFIAGRIDTLNKFAWQLKATLKS
jgi:starvation-inducible DNA-binding protein